MPAGSITVEDVLCDECQVPDAQLVSELLGQLPGQGSTACLAEARSSAGQEPVAEAVHRAQQDILAAADDGRDPQVERSARSLQEMSDAMVTGHGSFPELSSPSRARHA